MPVKFDGENDFLNIFSGFINEIRFKSQETVKLLLVGSIYKNSDSFQGRLNTEMPMFVASLYFVNRKLFTPTLHLTQQLTINRSRLFQKIDIFTLKCDFEQKKTIISELKRSAEAAWGFACKSLSLTLRTSHLTILFGPILFLGVPLYFCGVLSPKYLVKWIRWSLSRAGATFIKLGQWAATRPDVLPVLFCDELSKLHANAPCHGMKWNEKVVQTAFCRPLSDIFDEFDHVPIGSGTIAQVHRAKLKKSKRESGHVAVKITHPQIEKVIADDLLLLKVVSKLAHNLIPPLRWISLPEEVQVFSLMMQEQLNLRFEAFTLHRFSQNFEGTAKAWGHLPRIRFPKPIFPWVSNQCLVEDLIEDSIPIGSISQFFENDEDSKIKSAGVRKDLAVLGLRGFLQMLLWDNFVHADLHPGNILVTFIQLPRGNTTTTAIGELFESFHRRVDNLFGSASNLLRRIQCPGMLPIDPRDPIKIQRITGETDLEFFNRQLNNSRALVQLVFLDTGLVTELSRTDFKNFTDLFQALVIKGDGYLAGELMIDRSPAWAQSNVINREGFCEGLSKIVKPIFAKRAVTVVNSKAASLKEIRLDVILNNLFQLAREHHVRIDSAYTNLVMSLLCVEGLGRQLAPEMDLRPLLAQAALQYLIRP